MKMSDEFKFNSATKFVKIDTEKRRIAATHAIRYHDELIERVIELEDVLRHMVEVASQYKNMHMIEPMHAAQKVLDHE